MFTSASDGMAGAAAAAAAATAGTSSLFADDTAASKSSSTHQSMDDKLDIEKLIELKLEMANQQATIDTLKARLHNLEVTNSKL